VEIGATASHRGGPLHSDAEAGGCSGPPIAICVTVGTLKLEFDFRLGLAPSSRTGARAKAADAATGSGTAYFKPANLRVVLHAIRIWPQSNKVRGNPIWT
jgi:hypothetical protein